MGGVRPHDWFPPSHGVLVHLSCGTQWTTSRSNALGILGEGRADHIADTARHGDLHVIHRISVHYGGNNAGDQSYGLAGA